MRNPNGYGSVVKLSGNRRKPFAARITIGFIATKDADGNIIRIRQKQKCIGTFSNKADALAALSQFNANPYDLTAASTTMHDLFKLWYNRQTKAKPKTSHNYTQAYNHICEHLNTKQPIIKIKHAHMQSVLDQCMNINATTLAAIKKIFRECYALAIANNVVSSDATAALRITSTFIPKERSMFSDDELRRFLNAPIIYQKTTCYYDLAVVLLYTGMRINELINVKTADVEIDNRIIRVHGTKTKSADRIVPIHPDIMNLIQRRVALNDEYLFTTPRHKKICYNNYQKHFWNPFVVNGLLINHTPHELRHTYISLLQRSADINASDVRLKRIVGHASTSVTERYTHHEIQDLVALNDQLHIAC